MTLLPNATDGLYTAVISGLFGVIFWWLNRRGEKPARRDAWQKQAEALRNELRGAYTSQIASLEGRIAASEKAHDAEIKRKDAEIMRLNRLLNRQ